MAVATVTSLGGATAAMAQESHHVRIDPTSLTPPLKSFRVCYQDGPWVRCDTSGTDVETNNPIFDLPCGTVYSTGATVQHATRWYENLLLVERDTTNRFQGTWSLSSTGAGRSVEVSGDFGYHEHFLVPGDLSSDSEVAHGDFTRVSGMGADFRDVGVYFADGTHHGLASFTDDAAVRLCVLLTP
jgi:hypothetical protein